MEYMGTLENIAPFYYTSADQESVNENIAAAIEDSCTLIIALSSRASEYIVASAIANPDIDFILIDHEADTSLQNLQCVVFDTEEAAYPCGFLAAAYADMLEESNPAAGCILASEYPEADSIGYAYTNGINHYNELYNRVVASHTYNTVSISDPEESSAATDSLVTNAGVSILFPVSGLSNSGAYARIAELELTAIGMELDAYYDYPDYEEIFLSSCVKRYDLAVADKVLEFASTYFNGNKTIHYNLRNQGVWLAGYHDFLGSVPDSITQEINVIITDIISGTLNPLE
jgi:basic membrane protein A